MSLKKLSSMITKLEKSSSEIDKNIKGGLLGTKKKVKFNKTKSSKTGGIYTGGVSVTKLKQLITEIVKKELSKKGGMRTTGGTRSTGGVRSTGGKKKKSCGGTYTGGKQKKPKCKQCGYVRCRCGGGVLISQPMNEQGGVLQDFSGGDIQNFAGGEISDFSGGKINDFSGGRKKRMTKKKGGKEIPPQLQAWHEKVAKVRQMYPKLSYKEAIIKASKGKKSKR